MIKSYKSTYLILIYACFFIPKIWSQDTITSQVSTWYKLEYDDLSKKFIALKKDSLLYKVYATAYLKRAKSKKDSIKQSNGFYLLGLISNESNAIKYADSIINLTKDKKNFIYPAQGYLLKARNLGRLERYTESLDELIKANHYASKNGNLDQKNKVIFFIGILKTNIGELEDSLNQFKSTTEYYKSKFKEDYKYKNDYLKSLLLLNNGYIRVKKYDSAYLYIRKGMNLSVKLNDSIYYGYFLLSSGITHYYKKKYQSGLDSIFKFKNLFVNKIQDGNIAIADLYLGKIYYEINETEKAIQYLEKVDSISTTKLRSCYELLLKIYRDKNNTGKQVEYIDKILKVDSIINKNYAYLYKNIETKYTTPNLLLEKEQIINSLKTNKRKNKSIIMLLIVLLILVISILFYNNHRKKIYKQRFLKIYNEHNLNTFSNKELNKNYQNIGIPKDVTESILNKLEEFEKNKEYLNSGLTITELAKNFNTNPRYLSKVVNVFKEKSFSNYINDLRINYAIEELKQNHKFRKYTIKAIAHEIGFKSAEVFSKSFYKKTGIYPSFFLKELEKNENTNYQYFKSRDS